MSAKGGIDRDLFAFASGAGEASSTGPHKKKRALAADGKQRPVAGSTSSFVVLDEASSMAASTRVSIADLTGVLDDDVGYANLKRRIGDISSASGEGRIASKDGVLEGARQELPAGEPQAALVSIPAKVDIVAAPLPTIHQQRAEREAAYALSSRDASKWIPVIRANRAAKSLSYPENARPLLSSEALAASFTPKSALDRDIQAILAANGLASEEQTVRDEQLEMSKLTVEEVEKRYEDLAKKRALCFFGERKARQQAKIKSKSFRKVVKREQMRRLEKAAAEGDAEQSPEEAAKARMDAEMARIRERMTLKTHKASKWAHELFQKRRMEAGCREDILQQVRDKDRVRQEILGKAAAYAGASASDSSDGDFVYEGDNEHFKDSDGEDEEALSAGDRRPKALPSRKKGSTSSERPSARRPSAIDEYDGDEGAAQTSDEDGSESAGEIDQIFDGEPAPKETPSIVGRRTFAPSGASTEALRLQGGAAKGDNGAPPSSGAAKASSAKRPASSLFDVEGRQGEEDGEDEGLSSIVMSSKKRAQMDLIKRAFDGDDVFAEFEAAKAAEVDADAPKDIDLTLPGWGSWGGIGIAPPVGRVIKKALPGEGIEASARRDAKLAHVIIHERRAKKSAALMVSRVPFPFKSVEEYEKSLSRPAGREWNSTTTFAKKNAPRIQVRVGSIIDPIKFVKKASDSVES